MYAAIRQGKAKAGKAEELARTIKEGAIPVISGVPGFRAYYVIYAPDDTVTAISIFDDFAGAEELNKRGLAWIEQSSGSPPHRPRLRGRRPRDCTHPGLVKRKDPLPVVLHADDVPAPLPRLVEQRLGKSPNPCGRQSLGGSVCVLPLPVVMQYQHR